MWTICLTWFLSIKIKLYIPRFQVDFVTLIFLAYMLYFLDQYVHRLPRTRSICWLKGCLLTVNLLYEQISGINPFSKKKKKTTISGYHIN